MGSQVGTAKLLADNAMLMWLRGPEKVFGRRLVRKSRRFIVQSLSI